MNAPARYKADANQGAIVAVLRAAGCSVSLIQGVREAGVPDLLVGRESRESGYPLGAAHNETYLLEVKRPKARGQRAGKLSRSQEFWRTTWRGRPVSVVTTPEEALESVGLTVVG